MENPIPWIPPCLPPIDVFSSAAAARIEVHRRPIFPRQIEPNILLRRNPLEPDIHEADELEATELPWHAL